MAQIKPAMTTDAAATRVRLAEQAAIVTVAAAFALKLALALSLGLDGDEAYYTLWSAWPAAGYLDHPPGVALSIALGRAIAGESVLGVRLVALAAHLVVCLALWRTGRLLLPGSPAPALAVILYNLTIITASNFVSTPDVPSTLFWMLGLWAATEAMVRARPEFWLAVGVFAGFGLLSKYTNAFFGVGLVAVLVLTATGRAQFRHWQLWAGGALALLVFLPNLIWNAENGWRSLLFQGARVWTLKDLNSFGQPMREFLAGQAALVGPVLMIASAIGMVLYLIAPKRRAELALPVLTSLPVLLYFLVHAIHSKVEANWTQPVLPAMALLAAWLLCRPVAGWRRVLAGFGTILHIVLGAVLVALVYVQSLYQPLDIGAADRARLLRGWSETTTRIRTIASEVNAGAIWTAGTYRLAGEIFAYGRFAGDPRPVRPSSDEFRYSFIPEAERWPEAGPVLVVTESFRPPQNMAPPSGFPDAELLEIVPRGLEESPDAYYSVFVAAGPPAR